MTSLTRHVLVVAGTLLLLGGAILSGLGIFEYFDDGWFWPMAPYGAGLIVAGVACLVVAGPFQIGRSR